MRKLSVLFLFITISLYATCQKGEVYSSLSVESSILGEEMKFAIYLPPDYKTTEKSYPVLYLMPGAGDDQTAWLKQGNISQIADKVINDGLANPMVIVMPQGKNVHNGYFKDITEDYYEDFFFKEFIPFVEDSFRIIRQKTHRAISGLSVGIGGVFVYSMHHPELFSSACPLSTFIGPLDLVNYTKTISDADGKITNSQIENHFNEHNVFALIERNTKEQLNSVRWYIDCGDDDFLYEGNSMVHIAMRKKEISHEYRVRDGSHSWNYWRESLPNVLQFVSEGFNQK